jgi:hypothetical protein
LHYSPSIDNSPTEDPSESKCVPSVGMFYRRSSTVRFRLPLTPPQVIDMPPKYKEVSTKEASPEVFKLKDSASKWRRRDLDLLGVDYQYDKFDEIKIPVEGMPPELLARTVLFNVI